MDPKLEVIHISRESAYFKPALAMALRIDGNSRPSTVDAAVNDFLSIAERCSLDPRPLFGVISNQLLSATALGLMSPGRAAMVFVSNAPEKDAAIRAAALASLATCRSDLESRGVLLQQALISEGDIATTFLFRESGFRHLTNLLYLRLDTQIFPRIDFAAQPLSWVSYSEDRRPLFEEALESSYVNSCDCPELNNLRQSSEALESHRAVGEFHPELWWVALLESKPVGVLLLAHISRLFSTEIVYMGVSHFARGQGIANSLLDRAVSLSRQNRNTSLTAAVDERNIPARNVYSRWRFVQTAVQQAWIATSFPNNR
ncbi:MAG: GNAT family N-acetyltransferase [Planctomycetota bacterium]